MANFVDEVCVVRRNLEWLQARLAGDHAASMSAICMWELLAALDATFDLETHLVSTKKRSMTDVSESQEGVRLKRQVAYLQATRETMREERDISLGRRTSWRIGAVWFLRVGLSPPNIPPGRLADVCRDFNIEQEAAISRNRITAAKYAFCECIKSFHRQQLSNIIASSGGLNRRRSSSFYLHSSHL